MQSNFDDNVSTIKYSVAIIMNSISCSLFRTWAANMKHQLQLSVVATLLKSQKTQASRFKP